MKKNINSYNLITIATTKTVKNKIKTNKSNNNDDNEINKSNNNGINRNSKYVINSIIKGFDDRKNDNSEHGSINDNNRLKIIENRNKKLD